MLLFASRISARPRGSTKTCSRSRSPLREVETPEGWKTLPPKVDWEDVERLGVEVGLAMLYRDGFRLELEAVGRVSQDGLLSHLGVHADKPELERLHERAEAAGCKIVAFDRERSLIIDDACAES
jgi:hypothetical protein